MNRFHLFFKYFLAHPYIRYLYGYLRFIFFSKFRLKLFSSKFSIQNTVSHNLLALKNLITDFSMIRMDKLIYSVVAVEKVNSKSIVLVIGPRTESDILKLHGLGFENVTGLDLISYSPYIVLGDMHEMPFPDDHFDVVIMGWAITYSKNPNLVASEIIRVCKNGAVVGIGIDHISFDDNDHLNLIDNKLAEKGSINLTPQKDRINNNQEIISLFGKNLSCIYFNNDAQLKHLKPNEISIITGLSSSICMLTFGIKK
jgi:SAM-dependent methyltransferase